MPIFNCDCGHQVQDARAQVIVFNEVPNKYLTICNHCLQTLGTCHTCLQAQVCPFETDTSISLPKVILKTETRGNMTIQTQQLNPERIAKTCVNCLCWSKEENYCMKQNDGVCVRYASKFHEACQQEPQNEVAQ